ncbi:MAG TPA: type IV conjugative transfer system protein TraL [Burkholderiaceae bacterium]|nr:type IV conjugative transfer system protein TraL [Burkholderiaceae bacterium]
MDAKSIEYAVPRLLDLPPKIMFWDADVAAAALIGIAVGVAVGYPFTCAILGLAAAAVLQRMRRGRHPGYMLHVLYWHLPVRMFRRLCPSSKRLFCG